MSTKFTIPVINKPVRISAFANAALKQDITVKIPGVAAPFTVSGNMGHLKTQDVTPTAAGDWEVIMKVGAKENAQVSVRVELANKLNFAIVGSEDGVDMDYNDAVVIISWPVG